MSVRRLSQAISEGNGISVLVEVVDADAAHEAAADGADGLVLRGLVEGLRASTDLPLLVYGPSVRAAVDGAADAVVVSAADDDDAEEIAALVEQAASHGLECVVRVVDEESLETVLEQLDPELLLLAADAPDDAAPLDHLLGLLHDVPAGKLVVAELPGATRADVEELERAGVDAVLVSGDAAHLIADELPDV